MAKVTFRLRPSYISPSACAKKIKTKRVKKSRAKKRLERRRRAAAPEIPEISTTSWKITPLTPGHVGTAGFLSRRMRARATPQSAKRRLINQTPFPKNEMTPFISHSPTEAPPTVMSLGVPRFERRPSFSDRMEDLDDEMRRESGRPKSAKDVIAIDFDDSEVDVEPVEISDDDETEAVRLGANSSTQTHGGMVEESTSATGVSTVGSVVASPYSERTCRSPASDWSGVILVKDTEAANPSHGRRSSTTEDAARLIDDMMENIADESGTSSLF